MGHAGGTAPPALHFVDRNLGVITCLRRAFRGVPATSFNSCDLTQVRPATLHHRVAYVAGGNSFGMGAGGVDGALEHVLGGPDGVRARVRRAILDRHGGELHVGSCVVVESHVHGVSLAYAPTSRVPGEDVSDTLNVYLAFRAALLATGGACGYLVCCGLGDGWHPAVAAKQMRAAYDSLYGGGGGGGGENPDWKSIHENHAWMTM